MYLTVCLLDVWQEDSDLRWRNTAEAEVTYRSPMFVDLLCEELHACDSVLDVDESKVHQGRLLAHAKPDAFGDMRGSLVATILRAQDKASVAMRGTSP